jgi:chitinase
MGDAMSVSSAVRRGNAALVCAASAVWLLVGCGSSSGGAAASGDASSTGVNTGDGAGSLGADAEGADAGPEADANPATTNDAVAPTDASGPVESGAPDGATASGAWVMGYYAVWDEPANGGFYPLSAIDWDALTHVATAFYLPDGNGGLGSGSFDAATAAQIITAAHAHGKKAIASIGGADSGAMFEGCTSQANLSKFVTNLETLVTRGYDGIDIDWEGGNLSVTQDQTLEQSLIMAIRAASPGIILTFTAGYENENLLDDLSFYGTIAPEIDRLNLMTYGMSGAWQGWESWHSSPLHWNKGSSTPTGIDSSVSQYLAARVPASKLGVGAGFYGECYTSPVSAPVQTLGSSQVSASDGTMAYRNIMASYYSQSAYHYDSAADVPYLSLSGSNAEKCTYVSYEDATSLAAKGAWVKAQGLGGVIIWTISEGYMSSGATVKAQNPLLEALSTSLQ